MSEELTIGDLARRAGVATSAIRYYERIGLLPAPERVGGRRRYPSAVLTRLGAIGVAKRAGFTLAETRALLDADADGAASAELRELAARKLRDVEAQIARAQAMHAWLGLARECACETLDACALFGAGAAA